MMFVVVKKCSDLFKYSHIWNLDVATSDLLGPICCLECHFACPCNGWTNLGWSMTEWSWRGERDRGPASPSTSCQCCSLVLYITVWGDMLRASQPLVNHWLTDSLHRRLLYTAVHSLCCTVHWPTGTLAVHSTVSTVKSYKYIVLIMWWYNCWGPAALRTNIARVTLPPSSSACTETGSLIKCPELEPPYCTFTLFRFNMKFELLKLGQNVRQWNGLKFVLVVMAITGI